VPVVPALPPTVRFGNLVRMTRLRADLSQRALGELLGTTQSAVSAWESGSVLPRTEVILQLSRVLHVAPHALLDACEDDLDAGYLQPRSA